MIAFHVFKTVQMVPNRAKHHIWKLKVKKLLAKNDIILTDFCRYILKMRFNVAQFVVLTFHFDLLDFTFVSLGSVCS